MRRDYLLAIILMVAAIPGGAALMAAPEYLHLTSTPLALTFWGGVLLTLLLLFLAMAVALRGESQSPPAGHRQRMLAIVGMTVFGLGFVACAVWFFVPHGETKKLPSPEAIVPTDGIKVVREGQGGKGGSGEIFGNNGTIVGGKGGNVGPGGTGRGGDGGGGVIHGDGGTIVGGEGGSVDGTNVWFPPAQSGFIQHLESQGETLDFDIRYPGAGGASWRWWCNCRLASTPANRRKITRRVFQADGARGQDTVKQDRRRTSGIHKRKAERSWLPVARRYRKEILVSVLRTLIC